MGIPEIIENILDREYAEIDRHLKTFLKRHGLDTDRKELEKNGFEVIYTKSLGSKPFESIHTFKLCKVVDKTELRIKSEINNK